MHSYWKDTLSTKGQNWWTTGRKWEIIAMYYQIGLYWNPLLCKLKVGDVFIIPKTKYGIINGGIYQVLIDGTIKKTNNKEATKDIKIFPDGALFRYRGKLMWISRQNGEIISVSSLFTADGFDQINQRIDTYQHMTKYPEKWGRKDRQQFYKVPMSKIVWD